MDNKSNKKNKKNINKKKNNNIADLKKTNNKNKTIKNNNINIKQNNKTNNTKKKSKPRNIDTTNLSKNINKNQNKTNKSINKTKPTHEEILNQTEEIRIINIDKNNNAQIEKIRKAPKEEKNEPIKTSIKKVKDKKIKERAKITKDKNDKINNQPQLKNEKKKNKKVNQIKNTKDQNKKLKHIKQLKSFNKIIDKTIFDVELDDIDTTLDFENFDFSTIKIKYGDNNFLEEATDKKEDTNPTPSSKIDLDYSKTKVKKLKKQVYILAIIFLLFPIFYLFNYLLIPSISIKGQKKIVINYKSTYKEKGATASIRGKDISKLIKVSGGVNSNKLGKYKIVYTIKKGPFKKEKTREIVVKDLKAPKITLKGENPYYVCPNQKYKEPGYQVLDNYDKKIEDIKIEEKDNIYTYTAKDSSGNKTSIERKVIFEDKTPPVIKVEKTDVYIPVGGNLDSIKIEVSDNCDSNLQSKLKRSGNVDTTKVGEYKLTYSVADSSSNKATKEITVHVFNKGQDGTIYLTFDDGPNPGTTNVILDILKEENVKATFFVTNKGPDELIKREYDEGHSIGLHTASHDYSYLYSSVDNYFKDLLSVEERVFRITGIRSKIIRFPGGSSNTISRRYQNGIMSQLSEEVLRRGYKYYDWNLSSGDAGEVSTSEGVYNTVVKNLSKTKVNMILMHDIKPYTRDALRQIIRYAKEEGYTFDVINENTEMIRQKINN